MPPDIDTPDTLVCIFCTWSYERGESDALDRGLYCSQECMTNDNYGP